MLPIFFVFSAVGGRKTFGMLHMHISDATNAIDEMVSLSAAEVLATFMRIPPADAPTVEQWNSLASWASHSDDLAFWGAFKVAEKAMQEYFVIVDFGGEHDDELEEKHDQYGGRFAAMMLAKAMAEPMSDEKRLKSVMHFAEAINNFGLGQGLLDSAEVEIARLKDVLGKHA